MTIRKGIEPGAVLWKTKETRETYRWVTRDDGSRGHELYQFDVHFAIVLETRRARTQGYQVSPSLKPFFEQIRLRLHPVRVYNGTDRSNDTFDYIAVGTRRRRISEEEYHNLPIDEVAARWYKNIHNTHLTAFLDKYEEPYSDDLIEDMRAYMEDDESPVVEWTEEPRISPLNETLDRYSSPSTW